MKKWFIKHQFILIITGIAILVIGGISLFAWLILSNNEVVEGEHYTPTGEYALLDLGSTNCSPCIRLQPVLADLREEYGETIDIVFFDITNTQEGAAMANGYSRAAYLADICNLRYIVLRCKTFETAVRYCRTCGIYRRK